MKYLQSLVVALTLLLLAACGKHPSSLVGVWKTGDEGLFSAQIVLTLNPDGSGRMIASTGLFGGAGGNAQWEFADDKLTLRAPDGSATTFNVVSRSKTDLVLQSTEDGTLLRFTRISDC